MHRCTAITLDINKNKQTAYKTRGVSLLESAPRAIAYNEGETSSTRGRHPPSGLNLIEFNSIQFNSIEFKSTGSAMGAADLPALGDNKKCMAPRAMSYNEGDDLIHQRTSSPRGIEFD